MFPKNVISLLVNSEVDSLDPVIFETALNFSESGHSVWIYSPKQITKLPENVKVDNKQSLKLLTFLYLKDSIELLNHLNGVHLWHKTPKLVILTNFEQYCNLLSENYDAFTACFTLANLYDALKVFSNKLVESDNTVFLLATCNIPSKYMLQLEKLTNLYFPLVYHHNKNNSLSDTLNRINEVLQLNK